MGQPVEPSAADLPTLCQRLRHDLDESARWEAAEALGESGDAAAIPALLASITDPCAVVRLCVVEALGRIGHGDANVAPILCSLLTDADDYVRRFTLEALGNLGDPSALLAIRTRLARERRSPMVRLWIYYALHRLIAEPFPLAETFVLLRRGSMATRTSAAVALTRIATPANTPRIRAALQRAWECEKSEGMREVMTNSLACL